MPALRRAGRGGRHCGCGCGRRSWPRSSDQTNVNLGDADYNPLFAYGYGLTTAEDGSLDQLPEERASAAPTDENMLFSGGRVATGRQLLIGSPGALATNPAPDLITAQGADRNAQEDAVRLRWSGSGRAAVAIAQESGMDLTRQANGGLALELEFKVDKAPTADVNLLMTCGEECGGGFPVRVVSGTQWCISRRCENTSAGSAGRTPDLSVS